MINWVQTYDACSDAQMHTVTLSYGIKGCGNTRPLHHLPASASASPRALGAVCVSPLSLGSSTDPSSSRQAARDAPTAPSCRQSKTTSTRVCTRMVMQENDRRMLAVWVLSETFSMLLLIPTCSNTMHSQGVSAQIASIEQPTTMVVPFAVCILPPVISDQSDVLPECRHA